MLENSSFLSRFQYSANVKLIAKYLLLCDKCLESMRRNLEPDKINLGCKKCVNWNFLSDSNPITFEQPKKYPEITKDKARHLQPT